MPHLHLCNRAGFRDNAAKSGKPGHNRDIGPKTGTLGNYAKEALASLGAVASSPPSTVIQNAFKTGQVVEEKLAEDVLPSHEVKLWLDHLRIVRENRRRGAAKAAETRRSKQRQASNESEEYCGVCGDLYEEETDEVEDWIACDLCNRWFHWHYVNITTEPSSFVCISCAL